MEVRRLISTKKYLLKTKIHRNSSETVEYPHFLCFGETAENSEFSFFVQFSQNDSENELLQETDDLSNFLLMKMECDEQRESK